MKHLLLFLFLSALSVHAETAWPGVPFTEVRAYAWPDDHHTEAVILPDMKPKAGAINAEGAVLTPGEVQQLIAAATGKHAKHAEASCHIPHNAFVFYNAERKPVAFLEVCFGCLTTRTAPKGAASYPDLLVLASLFDTHKLPMGAYPNLAEFRKHPALAASPTKP